LARQFTNVAATSASNAWAVGSTGSANAHHTPDRALERQDLDHSPQHVGDTTLNAVTVISGDNAWAVGRGTVGHSASALALHWNGSKWAIVPGANPDGDAQLIGVTASWRHNIWAVGTTDYSSTLIAHWNGKSWSS
jgi:hypothetical protein